MKGYLGKSARTNWVDTFKMHTFRKNRNKIRNLGEGELNVRSYTPYKFRVFLNFFCFGRFLVEHLFYSSVLQINYYILLTHGMHADIKYRTQMHMLLCYIVLVSLPTDI